MTAAVYTVISDVYKIKHMRCLRSLTTHCSFFAIQRGYQCSSSVECSHTAAEIKLIPRLSRRAYHISSSAAVREFIRRFQVNMEKTSGMERMKEQGRTSHDN